MQYAINEAVYAVVGRGYPLDGLDIEARKKVLDEAGVSLDDLPAPFKHGSMAYLTPKLVTTARGESTQRKWLVDFEVPLFVEKIARERLRTILSTGSDIFRPERDL
jgi:hypothetical protein